MAYSYMTTVSDGTLKSMPITFNYMKEDDIVVHQNVTRLTKGIDYTINNNIITFAKVIPALDRIAVDRMSQRDSLRVDFTEGATFSRDNIDDVLTQLLYLTQEAVEGSVDRISPTGVLDLAGNRIINLGDPIDLQDAVPLHLVVDAEKSIYASEAKCKQYRDEALGYKNEAFTYADRAYASEINAKKSEDNAKASEINAANSAASILGAVDQAAASASAAKVSEANAKASADRAEATADEIDGVIETVQSYETRLRSVETGKISASGGVMSGRLRMNTSASATGNPHSAAFEVYGGSNSPITHGMTFLNKAFNNTRDWGTTIYSCKGRPIFFAMTDGINIPTKEEDYRLLGLIDSFGNMYLSGGSRLVYHSGNLTAATLGAVTPQTAVGAIANGALFEKGSNSNGTWVKYADGTIIMQVYCTASTGSSPTSSINIPVVFPVGGVTGYTVTYDLTARNNNAGLMGATGVCANITNRTQSQCNIYYTSVGVNFAANQTRHGIATVIGRWDGSSFLDEPPFDDSVVGTLDEPPAETSPEDAPQVLPTDPDS